MYKEDLQSQTLPQPSLWEWLLWLLKQRLPLRVIGDSMSPTLEAGDLVLVNQKAYVATSPLPGEVVVAWHPFHKDLPIVKRVFVITSDNRIALRSDNIQVGSDSRQFGAIAPSRLIGRVTCRVCRNPEPSTQRIHKGRVVGGYRE